MIQMPCKRNFKKLGNKNERKVSGEGAGAVSLSNLKTISKVLHSGHA